MAPHATLDAAVRAHAAQRPGAEAFVDPHGTLTWAELDEAADRTAAMLAARGVGPGDRVGWLGPNSTAYPVVQFGAWRLGASVAGLNWRLPAGGLAVAGEMVALAHVVADVRMAEAAQAIRTRTGTSVAGPGSVPWAGHPRSATAHTWADDAEAMVYFTSGSTGRPKAVPLIRHAVEAAMEFRKVHDFRPTSRSLTVPPSFHTAGGIWINYGVRTGLTQVFTDDPTPSGLVDTFVRRRISHAILVPTLIHSIVEELRRNPRALPDLRHVGYGASPITKTLLEQALDLLGCDFSQVYGMTEAGGGLCFLWPEEHRTTGPNAHRLASAGRPGTGVDVEVRDAAGERLPVGRSGELWFRAPTLTHGYIGDAEASRTLIADGWLNSRDVGRVDEDGYVYIEGRADDMIVTGAENVHPQAVEEVLAAMPGIQECAVYGVPDEHWGQVVAAAIVADPAKVTEADVVAHCKDRLAGYQVPRRMLFVSDLPRTAAGKVIRKQLSDMTTAG